MISYRPVNATRAKKLDVVSARKKKIPKISYLFTGLFRARFSPFVRFSLNTMYIVL